MEIREHLVPNALKMKKIVSTSISTIERVAIKYSPEIFSNKRKSSPRKCIESIGIRNPTFRMKGYYLSSYPTHSSYSSDYQSIKFYSHIVFYNELNTRD